MKFYSPKYKQLDLGLFRSSLDGLDKSNRWVVLGDLLPWYELEKEYNSRLKNQKKGAGNKPARTIIGALIIKHKLCLSDDETTRDDSGKPLHAISLWTGGVHRQADMR